MNDRKSFNESVRIVKLLTSSLFARKQPYLIINCTTRNTFYYTNIVRERVALYRATAEDVLSKVTISDSTVADALYEAFPEFNRICAILDLTAFSVALNKNLTISKDKFPSLRIDDDTLDIFVVYDKTDDPKKLPAEPEQKIGRILSTQDPEFYEDILTKFSQYSDVNVRRQFTATDSIGSDKISLEIIEVAGEGSAKDTFAYPFKDGVSGVSLKEYIKKRSVDPRFDITLMLNPGSHVGKALVNFTDDWLAATTIMPGTMWFLTHTV